jgi:hypothetical protein
MKKHLFLFACLIIVFVGGVALSQQPAKPVVLTADVNFGQEVLANPSTMASTGVGSAVFVLSADRTKVDYAVTFVGLSSPIRFAHLHSTSTGSFGVNGGVRRDLCGTSATPACTEGTLYTGTWSKTDMTQALTDERITELLAGQFYVNVHTMNNGGGEIRGQVVPISPK